ncbi:MAG: response regulator transcription factor [Acetobacteraceae bacterium]|nr:response regulator transcription factor [Acetobacteraceae bacterium]
MAWKAGTGRRLLVVVEPHELLRGCIRCWLDSSCPEFEALAVSDIEACGRGGVLRRAAAVLIGAHAPAGPEPWLEGQVQWLRRRREDLPVMITVDGHEPARAASLADRWGVQGCLPLSSSTDVAAAAIRLVAAGGAYRPREARMETPVLRERLSPDTKPEAAVLTPREEAVLDLLGRGLPNKVIAHELGMSLGTVKVHVHNIMAKLKVRNRTAAAVAARAGQRGPQPCGAATKPRLGSGTGNAAEL